MSDPHVPDLGIRYPENPEAHLGPVPDASVVLDKDYPFLDTSWRFRLKSALLYLGIFTLVFAVSPIRFGLKIEGRRNLRKHKGLLQKGALTVSNHVHRWDLLFVLQAIRYRRLYFPAWKENLSGPDRGLIRLAGGIPVPTELHLFKFFNRAFEELHKRKKWIHVFPESANWPYYRPIRPFKKGMFTLAWEYGIPVLPLAFSYRKPRGFYVLLNALRKQPLPMITLRVGEPIMPDPSLSRKEAVKRLREDCHRAVVSLAGITDNPWPCEGD